jgi:hypothetical protein
MLQLVRSYAYRRQSLWHLPIDGRHGIFSSTDRAKLVGKTQLRTTKAKVPRKQGGCTILDNGRRRNEGRPWRFVVLSFHDRVFWSTHSWFLVTGTVEPQICRSHACLSMDNHKQSTSTIHKIGKQANGRYEAFRTLSYCMHLHEKCRNGELSFIVLAYAMLACQYK